MSLPSGPRDVPVPSLALIVLDGWGLSSPGPGNAIDRAATPVFDELWSGYPHTTLSASGRDVGLPDGQMGNSEVGHMNIGAGRVVWMDLPRIDNAIADGSFGTSEALAAFGNLISGQAKGRLTGLPGIVKMIGGSIERGAAAVLALLAVLSINLFLFNLFPVPALDGGRLIFLGLEGVRRKPVDAKLENIVHTAGFLMLFGLILYVSLRDLFV